MASRCLTPALSIWYLKSGPASTASVVVDDCTRILQRNLLSLGLVEWQTSQGQAIIGTPLLVPVPSNVMVSGGYDTVDKMFASVPLSDKLFRFYFKSGLTCRLTATY